MQISKIEKRISIEWRITEFIPVKVEFMVYGSFIEDRKDGKAGKMSMHRIFPHKSKTNMKASLFDVSFSLIRYGSHADPIENELVFLFANTVLNNRKKLSRCVGVYVVLLHLNRCHTMCESWCMRWHKNNPLIRAKNISIYIYIYVLCFMVKYFWCLDDWSRLFSIFGKVRLQIESRLLYEMFGGGAQKNVW